MVLAEEAEAEAVADLEETEESLAKAEKTIADLERKLASAPAAAPVSPGSAVAGPAAVPVVNDVVSASKSASQQRAEASAAYDKKRDELQGIYEANRAKIAEQIGKLTTNLASAEAVVESIRNNAPTFSEQGSTFRNGERITTGVRTSAADREAANKKHQEQVAAAMQRVAAIQGEITATNLRAEQLETAYGDALKRAREEIMP